MPSKAKNPADDPAEVRRYYSDLVHTVGEIQADTDAAAQEAQSHADRIAALEAQVASIRTVLGGMGQVVE
jgi:hypothetical protein